MLSYCLKWRKNTESKNSNVVMTKDGRIMLLSLFAVFHSKKIKICHRAGSWWAIK